MIFDVLYNPSVRTILKTHQLLRKGYPRFLPGVSTVILPSNGHSTVVTRLCGKVFTGSLPSNGRSIVVTRLSGKVFTGSLPSNESYVTI
jgi:hypothetical protein